MDYVQSQWYYCEFCEKLLPLEDTERDAEERRVCKTCQCEVIGM